jgi:nucleoside-diphosphate-sugar epimerase
MTAGLAQNETAVPQRRLGRVLVTGARGFIGAALVERLRQGGEEVTASDLGRGEMASPNFQACDITEPRQVEALIDKGPFDTIFHGGAVSGPMVMVDQPLEIWRINVMGTAHLLEAARRSGTGRFVLCSSCAVYGPMHGAPIDEATPPDPGTVYGASKVAAEQAMTGYVREHGLDAVALRLTWVYGPGRQTSTTLESLLRAAIDGESIAIDGSPAEMTHYVFIDDIVEGLLAAGSVAKTPRLVYNLSAGPGVPFSQVVDHVRALEPEARIAFAQDNLKEIGPIGFDLTNAARDLGYRPRVPLAEGLRRYLKALRANGS